MTTAKARTPASDPTPSRQSQVEIVAAGRRAFYKALGIPCPLGHGGAGVACFVVPHPDEPGAGQGIGFGPRQDKPIVCPVRSQNAVAL